MVDWDFFAFVCEAVFVRDEDFLYRMFAETGGVSLCGVDAEEVILTLVL